HSFRRSPGVDRQPAGAYTRASDALVKLSKTPSTPACGARRYQVDASAIWLTCPGRAMRSMRRPCGRSKAPLRLVALAKELLHHFVEFVVAERHLYFRWPLFSGTFASNRCVERRPERPVPHRLWELS